MIGWIVSSFYRELQEFLLVKLLIYRMLINQVKISIQDPSNKTEIELTNDLDFLKLLFFQSFYVNVLYPSSRSNHTNANEYFTYSQSNPTILSGSFTYTLFYESLYRNSSHSHFILEIIDYYILLRHYCFLFQIIFELNLYFFQLCLHLIINCVGTASKVLYFISGLNFQ